GLGWRARRLRWCSERTEIEIGAAVLLRRGLRGRLRYRGRGLRRRAERFCRRRGGRRARRYFADEAVLVECRDERLEGGVEGLADLLRYIGERRASIDRGEHRAVGPREEARFSRGLLHSLSRLRVDGGRIHFFRPTILVRRAVHAAAGSRDHDA